MSDHWHFLERVVATTVLMLLIGGQLGQATGRGPSLSPDSSADAEKYWIFLADRPGASAESTEPPWTRPVAPSYLHRLRAIGVDVAVRSRWFHAVSALLSPATRTRIDTLPFVQGLRPVAPLRPLTATGRHSGDTPQPRLPPRSTDEATPPVSLGASRGPLSRINAIAPLARGLDGHGVRVGFLDAHFRGLRHPAFSQLREDGRMAGLRTFTERRQSGNHGAGVASVATGFTPGSLVGPAHGATMLGATTEYTQFERNVEEDYFVAGLEWLHRRGVDVVNVSIGYDRFDEGQHSYSPSDLDGDTALTTRAVDRAAQLGITVVVSAGNSGCASPDSCWFYVNTPADADSAIAVGAVGPDSALAPFSARGPTADGRRKPDVVVQGRGVTAAWGATGYAQLGGTSFASPQVTGIVAQMLQVNPDLAPMEVRRLLRTTASQANDPDTLRGWGVVDAEAALRRAEWNARKNPPSSLHLSAPYRPAPENSWILPVRAPAHTTTLHVSLFTPLDRRVYRERRAVHPGPNRLDLKVEDLPTGVYRYQVRSDTGHRETGLVTLTD